MIVYKEVVIESPFEVVLNNTSLEESIGVAYDVNELKDIFNAGHRWLDVEYHTVGNYEDAPEYLGQVADSPSCPNTIVMIENIVNYVKKQLSLAKGPKKSQLVQIDLSRKSITMVKNCNGYFKTKGFVYNSSKEGFVPYTPPNPNSKSNPKTKVCASVMCNLREAFTHIVQSELSNEAGFQIKFNAVGNKTSQAQVAKFGNNHGVTWDSTTQKLFTGYFNSWIEKSTFEQIVKIFVVDNNQPETMVSKYMEAFKNWYDESISS
jgi:hypothetical protein